MVVEIQERSRNTSVVSVVGLAGWLEGFVMVCAFVSLWSCLRSCVRLVCCSRACVLSWVEILCINILEYQYIVTNTKIKLRINEKPSVQFYILSTVVSYSTAG